ncbi:sialidase family protein [Streptomyces sp. 150FB]|uniref:sialidase family protein n=1 Tax=Streptomyces sp. 150FB TaxID=1576605 RepID=UPI0007C83959|nr:sialidase family protein [Streptomyces sp. 150FB]
MTHRPATTGRPPGLRPIAGAGLALLLTVAPLSGLPVARAAAPGPRDAPCAASEPYRSGTSGYHTFRIPAALQVPGGALLAFAEGRRNSAADDGDIDLVLRRSFDGGCTWEPLQVVADAGADTAGNPVPVIDPYSGDVVLLSCRTIAGATEGQIRTGAVASSTRRVYVQRSADGGGHFSAQEDITASVKPADWRWYATGPGHAVALRSGPHRGRLLAPGNHSSARTGHDGAHSLLSDDGGRSWRVGYDTSASGGMPTLNESTLAELPDGRVYISSRDHDSATQGARADAYSADGGGSLSVPFRPQPGIAGPAVEGSVFQVPGRRGEAPLLYSGPSDPKDRRGMQVRISEDDGASWRPWWTVSEDPAAYSDLVETASGAVGLLYETGPLTYHDTIRFVLVPDQAPSARSRSEAGHTYGRSSGTPGNSAP